MLNIERATLEPFGAPVSVNHPILWASILRRSERRENLKVIIRIFKYAKMYLLMSWQATWLASQIAGATKVMAGTSKLGMTPMTLKA